RRGGTVATAVEVVQRFVQRIGLSQAKCSNGEGAHDRRAYFGTNLKKVFPSWPTRPKEAGFQPDLFADFNGIPEGVDKTDFYQHDQNWSNLGKGDRFAMINFATAVNKYTERLLAVSSLRRSPLRPTTTASSRARARGGAISSLVT